MFLISNFSNELSEDTPDVSLFKLFSKLSTLKTTL
jgi:hypothetical protein